MVLRLLLRLTCGLGLAASAALAAAQEPTPAPQAPVAVAPLEAPDLFSSGAAPAVPDLWRGVSPDLLRAVLIQLGARPLPPAGQALARHVLGAGAPLGGEAGRDPDLAGLRLSALITQGGAREAADILAKTSGLDQRPTLARPAAELALLTGDPDRACRVGDGLSQGRDDPYWLRLRAYCQVRRGEADAAQLTFDLAQSQAKDPVYGRLMGVRLAGAGDPGPASLRTGLDLALSMDLGLDLSKARPSPAVAAVRPSPSAPPLPADGPDAAVKGAFALLAAGDPGAARTLRSSLSPADIAAAGPYRLALLDAVLAVIGGEPTTAPLSVLVRLAGDPAEPARSRAQSAALILAALAGDIPASQRAAFAGLAVPAPKAMAVRWLALQSAVDGGRSGEVALISLAVMGELPSLGAADRALIVRALARAGLAADARALAAEGLLALP